MPRSLFPAERRFAFCDQVQIGRDDEGCALVPGVLLVADPAISRRHCIVRQSPDGRCFVRDVSRNGTRLDGRRMVPNLEVEIRPGQVVRLDIIEHTHAVTLLPLDDEQNVWFVRQYRHSAGRELLELPAGILPAGENPADGARRERSGARHGVRLARRPG